MTPRSRFVADYSRNLQRLKEDLFAAMDFQQRECDEEGCGPVICAIGLELEEDATSMGGLGLVLPPYWRPHWWVVAAARKLAGME